MNRKGKLAYCIMTTTLLWVIGCGGTIGTIEGGPKDELGPRDVMVHGAFPDQLQIGIEHPVVLPPGVTAPNDVKPAVAHSILLPGQPAVEQPILLPGQVRPAVEQPIVLPSAGRQPAGVGSAAEGAADSDVDADTDGNGRDPGEPEEAVAEVVLPSAGGQARLASPPHQELAKPPAMRRGSLRPTLQFEWVERISPACPAGLELCGESCVNILFDPLNCGECARSCATPQCFLGRCVKSGP